MVSDKIIKNIVEDVIKSNENRENPVIECLGLGVSDLRLRFECLEDNCTVISTG